MASDRCAAAAISFGAVSEIINHSGTAVVHASAWIAWGWWELIAGARVK